MKYLKLLRFLGNRSPPLKITKNDQKITSGAFPMGYSWKCFIRSCEGWRGEEFKPIFSKIGQPVFRESFFKKLLSFWNFSLNSDLEPFVWDICKNCFYINEQEGYTNILSPLALISDNRFSGNSFSKIYIFLENDFKI